MINIATVRFNSGEMTPKIDARSDTEKYSGGCRSLRNMIPLVFGGAERRPGTQFINDKATFNAILVAIVAYENIVCCLENTVLVTDFDTMLSQIACWENDVLCYENEIVIDSGNMDFLERALCYEGDMMFYENEVIYT